MTYFFQPHFAWEGVAGPRLAQVTDNVGFVHFGPLVRLECGHDMRVDITLPVSVVEGHNRHAVVMRNSR